MSAENQLRYVYAEWSRLAKAEGEAIHNADWFLLADCQKALLQLQPQITRQTQAAREEWTLLGFDLAAKEKDFQTIVTALIEIERQNNTLLETKRQAALGQLSQLENAGRTLRRVRRSYAEASPSAWTSFS
jgi:hypothetical protein